MPTAVVELRCSWVRMVGKILGLLEATTVLQVERDAGRPERMAPDDLMRR
ncbi:MAG: hypothetical protein QM758_05410 [Armatimonas sp.]